MGCAVWGTGESRCRKERGNRGSKENGSHLMFLLGVGERLATEPGCGGVGGLGAQRVRGSESLEPI